MDSLARRKRRQIYSCDLPSGKRTDLLTTGGQGKYIRYKIPTSEDAGDIALIPTILSALSHATHGNIRVSKKDYRIKVKRKNVSTHTLIILDTSSSMMEGNKLRIARRCLDQIFIDTYQKRDRIGVITVGGDRADYLLPFTSNIEKGRNLLDIIPLGGTTPLSSGLRVGLEILEDLLRKEPWMVPIMIVITDGMANVPISIGGSIHDEFNRIAADLEYASIRPLIIQVGEGSQECQDLVWRTDGHSLHLSELTDMYTPDLDFEKEVEFLLRKLLLSSSHQETTYSAFMGFDKNTVQTVKQILSEDPMIVDQNEGCHFGCSSDDLFSQLCTECDLREEGEIERTSREMGTGFVTEFNSMDDLLGNLFVRYVVSPGELMKAHRGLLFIENEAAAHQFYPFIKECSEMGKCMVSNDHYTNYFPFNPRGILLFMEDNLSSPPRGFTTHSIYGDIRATLWKVRIERRMKTESEVFIDEMEEARKSMIADFNRLVAGSLDIEVPDYISHMVEKGIVYGHQECVDSLMKTSALIDGRYEVGLRDVSTALDCVDTSYTISTHNSSHYLYSKLLQVVSAKDDIKLTLVDGYSKDEFDDALRRLEDSDLTIDAISGCEYNCKPGGESLCHSCAFEDKDFQNEVEEKALPIIRISGDETLSELRGELFVKYLLTSETLLKANRGFLIIESQRNMYDDVALFLRDLLETGGFTINNDDHQQTFKLDISVIVYNDDAGMNSLTRETGYIIRKEPYENMMPPLDEDDGELFDRIIQRVKELSHSRAEDVGVSDDIVDYTVRVCSELGVKRYDAEMKIELMARVMSMWDDKPVDIDLIDRCVVSLAPILLEHQQV